MKKQRNKEINATVKEVAPSYKCGVNKDQVNAWKAQYGEVVLLAFPLDGSGQNFAYGYFRKPDIMVIGETAKVLQKDAAAYYQKKFDLCLLACDPEIKGTPEGVLSIATELQELFKTYPVEVIALTGDEKDLPCGVTPQQVRMWLKSYGGAYRFKMHVANLLEEGKEEEGEKPVYVDGFFRKPDLPIIGRASKIQDSDPIGSGAIFFDTCWLTGDEIVRSSDEHRVSCFGHLSSLVKVRKAIVKNV